MNGTTPPVVVGQTGHLLVVDDEEQNRELLRDLLEAQDHKVTEAENGKQALQMVIKDPPDVILLDVMMPEVDGFEVCRRLKANPATAAIPVLLVTALKGRRDRLTGIAAGASDFLSKPIDTQEVILRVRNAVRTKHLLDAEKDLLEKTLTGSVKVLTEMLSMANPTAFSRASRIVPYVRHIVNQLDLSGKWEFELAAMLSQIGCISLPPDVLDKVNRGQPLDDVEHKAYSAHPEIGYNLINNIPRLGSIAEIIRAQRESFNRSNEGSSLKGEDRVALGGHILKTALDFDQLLVRGLPTNVLTRRLGIMAGDETPEILAALADYESRMERKVTKKVRVDDLDRRMVLDQDVFATDGLLLASKGQEISFPVLARLRNYAEGIGVVQPIKVIVPSLRKRTTSLVG